MADSRSALRVQQSPASSVTWREPQTLVLDLGFRGGPVDKNQPAKAEDMGLIPGLERSHMPHRAPGPVSPNY